MSNSSLSWLSSLTLPKLRSLLASTGLTSSGTKAALLTRLQTELHVRRLPQERARIVSVDMGIRNLAFCVVDVELPPLSFLAHESRSCGSKNSSSNRSKRKALPTQHDSLCYRAPVRLSVREWTRLALPIPNGHASNTSIAEADAKESFHPRFLSQAAYALLHQTLLPHKPTTLLLERQRYRSGGAPAIQEWTVRVNMLESMLWAVLETLRHQNLHEERGAIVTFPGVHDVNPARVAAFWTAAVASTRQSAAEALESEGRRLRRATSRKIEKSDKVKLVRSWVAQSAAGADADVEPSSSFAFDMPPEVRLSFSSESEPMRHAFLARHARTSRVGMPGRSKRGKVPTRSRDSSASMPLVEQNESDHQDGSGVNKGIGAPHAEARAVGKLDDLADCLLQAAAWAAWEANRRAILGMGEERILAALDRA